MPAGRPRIYSDEERLIRNQQIRSQWRLDHPDKVRGYHAKYAAKPDVKERKRVWATANKDAVNARRRELYRLKQGNEDQPMEDQGTNDPQTL